MTFSPGPEAEELRGVVRDFLQRRSSESDVRRLMETETGYDIAVWQQAARELGLQGLVIPERWGGSEASLVELGVVVEEMGRALFGGPFLGTAHATTALLAVGDAAANAEYFPLIAAGDLVATVAWGTTDPLQTGIIATQEGDGWDLTGTADVVIDAPTAGLVLVPAETPHGRGLFATTPESREPLVALDSSRRLTRIRFLHTPSRAVGTPGSIDQELDTARDQAVTLLACEQLGGAAKLLEMSVDYANMRVQFGRKIGSFQAIKHRCADMLIEVESARSTAHYATWAAVHEPDDLPVAASLAGAVCSEAYTRAALDNIQIHGGIGFTWEHPAHLYLKRAKSSQLFLGSPPWHRSRLGHLLEVPEVFA